MSTSKQVRADRTTQRPFRRWLHLEGSPVQLGASRLDPNRIDYLAGRRVRRLAGELVLPGKMFRLGEPFRVRVLAWDHLWRSRYHRRCPAGSLAADGASVGIMLVACVQAVK